MTDIEYTILVITGGECETALGKLKNAVNKALAGGWRCEGGVAIATYGECGVPIVAQAMTRSRVDGR